MMNSLKYWSTDEFEISTYKDGIPFMRNKVFFHSGTDNTKQCKYTYNELGFRGDSMYKEGFKVMSIGCSNTHGVGVQDNETWPAFFVRKIPNGVDMNFGTGGRSNDFISRCLITYYDLIKPDLVLIMYTSPQRREFYTEDGGIEPFMPSGAWGYFKDIDEGVEIQKKLTELQNDNEDFINWYKNHLLIKYFLESKGCNWLWNGWHNVPKDYEEYNRFDGDYEHFLDFGVDKSHPGPKHNSTYSLNLYNYIYKNFRDYLPKESTPIKQSLI